MIITFNATAYDARPSGARNRTVGLAAALLRAKVSVRIFVPYGHSIREDVAREHGGEFPGDHFEQIGSPLDPANAVRRSMRSRNWFARRISRETDAFVTDYYPLLTKLPTLVTAHDLRYFAAPRHERTLRAIWFRSRFPKIARRAARLVVPTEAVLREAVEFLGVDASRVVVVGNGLSRQWRTAEPAGAPGTHFLAVGMSERRKDLAVLLAAMRLAPAAPPLVVVTRGRRPFAARDLVDSGRIRFVDTPTDADVVALCRGAVALLHPSRYEGFGLPVIEAMSVGVPVLAARQAAVEEVAGGFATLLPPGDAAAWAAAMSSVPPVPPGARDRAHAFTWDRAAASLVSAVEAVASEA